MAVRQILSKLFGTASSAAEPSGPVYYSTEATGTDASSPEPSGPVPSSSGLSDLDPATEIVPAFEDIFGAPLSDEADAFLVSCQTDFNLAQNALLGSWLAGQESYGIDLETGVLNFSRTGKPALIFDLTVVGCLDPDNGTWEWAWNNPHIPESISVPQAALAEIASQYSLKFLSHGFIPVPDEHFGWFLCGLAMEVAEAVGAYQAEVDGLQIYVLLRNPRESS